MSEPVSYHRLLMADRGIGLYERRTYTSSAVSYDYGFAFPRQQNRTEYLLVRGPVFLPDKANDRDVISRHETKKDALAALEQLVQARFYGESGKTSESPLPS